MRTAQGFFIQEDVLIIAQEEVTEGAAELKYCEFCGALWLRPSGSADTYCGPCAQWIEAELPRLTRGEA
jgi:hypothetical protein